MLLILCPLLACAQSSPQDMMLQGIQKLSVYDKVTVETLGQERRGASDVDLRVVAGLLCQPDSDRVKIELITYEDGKLVNRMAGDGTTIWIYDERSKTYSSSAYTDSEGALKQDWKHTFFGTLRLRASGATAFAVRFLDDIYGVGPALGEWRPWIPTATVTRVDKTVVCDATNPTANSTVYSFNGDDQTGWDLIGASFTQPAQNRSWSLTVDPGHLPSDIDFRFVPPRGAKPVAIDRGLN
ncbi:MAG: hypothetical protein JSS66_04380 [Armatimonadetes bacterium]|nr:hypothetical protein [Armatimonadota bacterium]